MAQSHQRPFSRRQLAVIAKIAFIEAMALSLIIPTISSTGEITTPITSSTGPINFLSVIFQNSTIAGDPLNFLTTPTWTTSQNETMIVVASSQNTFTSGIVTSVKDLLLDTFTLVIRQHEPIGGPQNEPTDLEVWIGRNSPSKQNSITVTWNITNQNSNMIQVLRYQNIASIAQSTGQANNCSVSCPQSPSVSLTTIKAGDWIFGSIATQSIPGSPATTPCPGQVSSESISFISRNKGCSTPDGTDGVETWTSDNNTSLRNNISIIYQPTLVGVNQPFAQVEVEFIPIDVEPQQQNINLNTICMTTGDTCHINFVNKVSGINTLQNIVVGTAYCTGITTSAMTQSSGSNTEVLSTYNGQSRNDTGAILLVQIEVSTNVPSTSFGAGQCATGGTIVANAKITFTTSGATTTTYGLNEYGIGLSGVCSTAPCNSASTIYAWIEITPQSVGLGNLGSTIQFAQWAAIGHSTISMFQAK